MVESVNQIQSTRSADNTSHLSRPMSALQRKCNDWDAVHCPYSPPCGQAHWINITPSQPCQPLPHLLLQSQLLTRLKKWLQAPLDFLNLLTAQALCPTTTRITHGAESPQLVRTGFRPQPAQQRAAIHAAIITEPTTGDGEHRATKMQNQQHSGMQHCTGKPNTHGLCFLLPSSVTLQALQVATSSFWSTMTACHCQLSSPLLSSLLPSPRRAGPLQSPQTCPESCPAR